VTVRLGTRGSRLALAQAELAAEGLRTLGHAVAIVPISTLGDRDRRHGFAELGGRGVFVREIEEALLDGRVDVAVHSAKDLTGDDHPELALAACLPRADPRDAWCGPARSLAEVPPGARVGTASLRRTAELLGLRADLVVEPVRGNVDTRLRKRTERGLDGVLLAACGLERLGLQAEIGFRLDVEAFVPEVGQGVVALQTRRADVSLAAALDDADAHAALRAERAVVARLGGGCTAPVAAHAAREDGGWRVRGWVGRPDGGETVAHDAAGDDPQAVAAEVAERLLAAGGAELLAAVRA
jgi:hydroxymethylbilane synthase